MIIPRFFLWFVSSSVIFLLRPWWSHICLNLRPISVHHNPCCFVTAYCMHILCASAALNCLVCTRARVIFTAVSGVELCSTGCILLCSLQRDQGFVLLLVMERAQKWWGSACRNCWVSECLKLIWNWKTHLKHIPVGRMHCSNVCFPKAVAVGCVVLSVLFLPYLSSSCILMASVWAVVPDALWQTVSMSLVCHGEALSSSGCSSEGWAWLPGYAAPEQLYTNSLFSF